jgi:hypothetical protein
MKLKILFFPMSIMLSLVIFIWMTKPEWDSYQQEKKNLAVMEKEAAKIDGQLQLLNTAYSQYGQIGDDEKLIINALPSDSRPDELIAEFYLKAKESEVFVVDAKIDKESAKCAKQQTADLPAEVSKKGAASSPAPCTLNSGVSLAVAGSYANIKKFLGEIEKMNRFTMIKGYSISKGNAEEQGDILNLSLNFNVFSRSESPQFQITQHLDSSAGKALLTGKIDKGVIDEYKQKVTQRTFMPVVVDGVGKEDIFK